MKRPISALALALMAILPFVVAGSSGLRTASAADLPWAMASETYYRLDVPNGTSSVTVDAKIRNIGNTDLPSVILYALPLTTDLAVVQDGKALVTTSSSGTATGAPVTLVTATFEKPLKKNTETTVKMTYVAPPQTSEYIKFVPGALEAVFLGQGPGSFVLLDAPKVATSYYDPGCLLATNQPKSVVDDGLERWVCGEASLIALNSEDKGVLKQCAGMDDRCRQRLMEGAYSAYGQSVTDASLLGTLEEPIELAKGPVTISIRYFNSDAAWAKEMFALAKLAMPQLEALFGFPYPHDSLVMLQSTHIENIGFAGLAFPSLGQVLVAPGAGFDRMVTVHELAHQWAGFNVEFKSMWEGLAEWAAVQLAPALGYPLGGHDIPWQEYPGSETPLVGWDGYWGGSASFWYNKAGAFYAAYEQAVGGRANMTAVLGQVGANPEPPRDHRWFMDRGEEVSGANLDELYLTWVFYKDTAAPLIAQRRAAHTAVAELKTRASAAGLTGTPNDIQADLNAWEFSGISNDIKSADAVIVSYTSVLNLAAESGVEVPSTIREAWPVRSTREMTAIVEQTRQAIIAINDAAAQLSEDALGQATLQEAREAFTAGQFDQAKLLASRSTTMRFNIETAEALISVALEKQANFKPTMFTKIGLFGKNPDADLAAAQVAMTEGRPEDATALAKSAYKSWDGAAKGGMARLAIAFGLLAALACGTYWLLKKLDTEKPDTEAIRRKLAGGHVLLPAEERKQGWKDWDNAP